jgi:3-deoxy-7-phosphoheptulonate synthase
MRTDDLRIRRVRPLIAPAILAEDIPLTDAASTMVENGRRAYEAILDGRDTRLAVIVGPCSIHDPLAAVEYAARLRPLADAVADRLLLIMRVYFEKPRTTVGWKGLINDPDLDGSFHISRACARRGSCSPISPRSATACRHRISDTTFGQFYADLVSWGAIGAQWPRARSTANSLRACRCRSASRTAPTARQVAVDALLAAGVAICFRR